MHQIMPFPLWVGHAGDGRAFREIFANGIRAIVQLAIEEPPLQLPHELIYQRFPLLDGEGNDRIVLHLAINAVSRLIKSKIPALVCCGAGMSRSPVIVAAALALSTQSDLGKCIHEVLQNRAADISVLFLADVEAALTDIKSRHGSAP